MGETKTFPAPHDSRKLFSKYIFFHRPIAILLLFSLNAYPATVIALEPPPTIDNPQLFTSDSSGTSFVTQSAGALTERFQLTIPPGRNGLAPDLALSYNSQDLSDGIFGYGWGISIPYIERINKTGSERLYNDNYFSSSLGGELATTTTANEYRHRIEDGRFIKYTFTGGTWTAYDKNGTQYKFGTSSASQMSATTSPSNVYRWMLSEIRDTNNNFVRYTYWKDGNQIYPYQIFYTGNNVTDGIFRIDFATSTRFDKVTSYKPAFKVTTDYRISEIRAYASSTLVRKHTFGYSYGVNGYRSMLASITETGIDEAGVSTVLPATTFTYSSSTPTYEAHTNPRIESNAYTAADVDGNGLPDRSTFLQNTPSLQMYRVIDENEYPTFNLSNTNITTEYWAYNDIPAERGVRFFDFNGDGKADILRSSSNNGAPVRSYAGNQGSFTWGATGPATSTIPTFVNWLVTGNQEFAYSTGLLGNVNGDGLVDYTLSIASCGGGSCDTNGTYLNTGTTTGWQRSTSSFSPKTNMPTSASDLSQSMLVDINADGLDDWMYSAGGNTVFYLNTGILWDATTTSPWNLATSTRGLNGWDKGIRFIDVNGDDLPDYVRSYNNTYTPQNVAPAEKGVFNYVYLNTGNGFATSTMTLPGGYIHEAFSPGGGWWYGDIDYDELVDWNGDGIPDNRGNTSTSTATAKNDILNKITYPSGGSKEVEYKYSAQFASANPDLPFPVLVVTKITNKDGLGTSDVTTYAYEGGKMYFPGDVRDRRFATFKTITKTDALGITKTYFNQGDSVDTATGERTDSWQQIGKPYREDVLTLASATMRKTFTKWNTFDQGNSGRGFVYKESDIVEQWDGDADHRDVATEYTYATSTGNVLQKIDRGEVTSASDGTFTDLGTDSRFTTLTYGTTTPINLSLLVSSTLTNYSSSTAQQSRFYYDSQPFGSTTKGNLTKEEKWISGTIYASSTKAYNTFGVVTSETDPNSKTTTYTIEANNLYVGTTTNALGHTTGYVYNYAIGKPRQVTYPDGRTHKVTFDGVGRQRDTLVPDPSTGVLVTQSQFTYYDNIFPRSVLETKHLNSATSTDTYTYTDGLGRVIQERRESDGTFAVKDRIFGNNGLLSQESLPYFSTGTTSTGLLTSGPLLVSYSYDSLKRVTGITNVLGTETHVFDQWTETITDRENHPKALTSDAYGNLAQVTEYLGEATLATTTYTYDTLNNLTKLTDAAGNVRHFGYDGLSRATSSQDLHAPADTTYASTTYTYDLAGNLLSRRDQKNQLVNWTYDSINRVLAEDDTGVAGTEVTYTYDSCTNGTSSLCIASSTSARTTNTYDFLGRVKDAVTTIAGASYTTTQVFDRQGNLSSVTYPNGSLLSYTYDSAGMLDKLDRKPSGGVWSSIIKNIDYGPTGAPTLKVFGSGATTTYTYDANALYRLTRLTTTGQFITATTTVTPGLPAITAPSHYWKLDENSGTVADSVGSMTLTNNNSVSYPPGKINNGADFEATNSSYFNTTTDINGSSLTAFTISFWYKPESQPGTNQAQTMFYSSDAPGTFLMYYQDTAGSKEIRFYILDNTQATRNLFYTVALPTAEWSHIAARWDGSELRLYVNGVDSGQSHAVNNIYTGGTLGTFFGSTGGGTYVDGMLDEIGFWPSSLSSTDISNLYNNGSGRSYPFNASSSTTATTTSYAMLQDINYTYDKVGNITNILDMSSTTAAKTVLFTYDWLNRLTLASTTYATSSPYKRGFVYDWLGNLLQEGTSTVPTVPITAPTHYWKLDEASGTAADSVGSITLTNNNTTAYTPAKIGNGADFERTNNNYFNTTTDLHASTLTAFTVSFWYRPESQPGTGLSYLLFTSNDTQGEMLFYYEDVAGTKQIRFYIQDNTLAAQSLVYTTALTDGTWYHIVGKWDGTQLKLFINGTDTGQTKAVTTIGTNAGNNTYVGGYTNGAVATDGVVDEVGFWPSSLTSAEISELYNFGVGKTYPFAGATGVNSNTYLYQGTNYTNPHAPTAIGNGIATTTYTYDNVGNLIQRGTRFFTWNYNNWLTNITGTATSTFWYDHLGSRVLQIAGGATTTYPSRLYSVATTSAGIGTTTEYIYAGADLVATIDSNGGGSGGGGGGGSSDTGYKNPTASGEDINQWLSPLNATSSDNRRASQSGTNKRQDYYNFTLGVPSGATINGIEVSAEGDTSGAYTGTMLEISLSWNGGTSTTTAKSVIDNTGTPGDTTVVIGGSADTWGRTWTDTELNDTNFRLHAKNVKTTGPWNVDHFKVKVYYTTGGGGGGGGGSSSSTVSYIHPDHLGSTNVVSDSQMNATQVLDYMPYGSIRVNTSTNGADTQRKYIKQFFDAPSSYSYLNARYYDPARGQFLSQDPMFWRSPKAQNILNPQSLNSYAYANGNPVNLSDPTGETPTLGGLLSGLKKALVQLKQSLNSFARNPSGSIAQAGHGAVNAIKHPIMTGTAVKQSAQAFSKAYQNASDDEQGQLLGQLGGELLINLVAQKGFGAAGKVSQVGGHLPDSTLVCRGGSCSAAEFSSGTGVKVGADGSLSGVSVFVGITGQGREDLLGTLPSRFKGQGGFTTLGQIRATSAGLTQTGGNPLHYEMSNLTAQQMAKLFGK